MHLIVGLGNPGPDYSRTRHNVGFMAIDEIISCYGFTHCKVKKRPHGEFTNGQVGSNKLILLKPLSFMNESGKPVGEAMRYFGLDTTQIVVFHDEIDLVLGKIRVKSGGGHAGHNGIRDIEKHVGNEFHRVRLGVGRPHSQSSVSRHVLGSFSRSDRGIIEPMLKLVAEKLPLLLADNTSDYMSEISRNMPSSKAGNNS